MNALTPLTAMPIGQRPALADPFVFRAHGMYYAIGTAHPATNPAAGIFPALVSDDFVHWREVAPIVVPGVRERWSQFWAPEVAERDGKFYIYFGAGYPDDRFDLMVAVGSEPLGPYELVPEPVVDTADCPFAIDAHPYLHADGQWYLYYARDILDTARPGTSVVVQPLIDMVKAEGKPHVVARARHEWQRYQANRTNYGQVLDWHTLEGPTVICHDARLYCLYSGGNWQNESYGVDYVSALSPLGDYSDDNPGECPRILKTIPNVVFGPGHNSLVTGPDGLTYVAYHAWDDERYARRFCLDPLVWTEDGPRCYPGGR